MFKIMIEMLRENCTACGACISICSIGCISFQEDNYGFLFPVVDKNKCIKCGECIRVCPQRAVLIKPEKQTSYVVKVKSVKNLLMSSSGGAFFAIAKYIIDNNGVVYGCAFDKDIQAKHIRTDNLKDLKKIQGSKYVQSRIDEIFKEIQRDLNNSKLVLFSGTPCQVAGLKSYLGIQYENLITVDLICHGIPSQSYFNKYLAYFEKKNTCKIIEFHFRSKSKSNGLLRGLVNYKGLVNRKFFLKKLHYADSFYYYYFLHGFINREVCYNCKYANMKRQGDFTIGDFWGIETIDPKIDTRKGLSLVITNTKRADILLKDLEIFIKKEPIDIAIAHNEQLKKPQKYPKERDVFIKKDRLLSGKEIQKKFQKKYFIDRTLCKIKAKIPYFITHFIKKYQ